MNIHPVILWTDALVFLLVLGAIVFFFYIKKIEHFRIAWHQVLRRKAAIVCMVILASYVLIALLDSIHYEINVPGQGITTQSVFDLIISPLNYQEEKTYSAPFASTLYTKVSVIQPNGSVEFIYPPLEYAPGSSNHELNNIISIILKGTLFALLVSLILCIFCLMLIAHKKRVKLHELLDLIVHRKTEYPYLTFIITLAIIFIIAFVAYDLSRVYHILGTDKVGNDVFYETLKSIRTGLIIGTVTTLIVMPFAVILGMSAGYFGGKIDDTIQFIYTTLSSIPDILLIAAAILSINIYIGNHPDFFPDIAQRADIRLLALCCILGITSWTNLCRLLRGETLKLREQEYVLASRALGAKPMQIIFRHILPNLMHLILIAMVMDFSGLVLAEAVLTYVGVGVDPTTISWGNMINVARLELARDPIVWWPLFAAFIFMFVLVIAANIFADIIRDALDPRINHTEN